MEGDLEPTPEGFLEDLAWLRGLTAKLVADAGVAEDLVQETWLAALRTRPGGRPSRPWLATVARRFLYQRKRREAGERAREELVARSGETPPADEVLERAENQRLVFDAVMRLSEPYRETVLLRYLEGLEPKEIALRQGKPAGTVRRRLKEGLERLREDLDRRFDGGRAAWVPAFLPLADWRAEPFVAGEGLLLGGALGMGKVVLGAAVMAIVVSVVWLTREDAQPSLEPGAEPAGPALATRGADSLGGRASPSAEGAAVEAEASQRRAAVAPQERIVLAGRVEAPAGCALDDRMRVYALDEATDYVSFAARLATWEDPQAGPEAGLLGSALVGADGGFRLEVPEQEEPIALMVHGDRVYLEDSEACPGSRSTADLVLRPRSGALVRGRVEPPVGAQANLAELVVELGANGGRLDPSASILGRTFSMDARVDAEGNFELRAIPTDYEYRVVLLPTSWAPIVQDLSGLGPCDERPLRVPLQRGARVGGRVLDPEGQPVEGATVEAFVPGRWFGLDDLGVRTARTDARGDFAIDAVPPGRVVLAASAPGWLESPKTELELADREEQAGVELVLDTGLTLSGSVAWEDGRPARDVAIDVGFDRAFMAGDTTFNALRGRGGRVTSDASGAFQLSGLGHGPFVVEARVEDEEGVLYRSRRDGVEPEGEPLSLVLRPPLALEGRVVPKSGAPLTQFRVHATRVVEGAIGSMGLRRLNVEGDPATGTFRLENLEEGTWELWAESPGWISPEPLLALLPGTDAPVILSVVPEARLSGIVLDPQGFPAPDAEVRLTRGGPSWEEPLGIGMASPPVRTDAEGRFLLAKIPPGAHELVARADDFGEGEAQNVEVSPGLQRDDLTLHLRYGVTIAGEVFDDRGYPAVGRMIYLEHLANRNSHLGTSDEEGGFRFEHLSAGPWRVVAMDTSGDWSGMEGGLDYRRILTSMKMAQIELEDGEESWVVLGRRVEDPVTLLGRVERAGEPHVDAWVSLMPADGGGMDEMRMGLTDDRGRFEVELDGAGPYRISIQRDPTSNTDDRVDYLREIEPRARQRMDFELPLGELAGRVLDPEGEPVAGARVSLYSEGRGVDPEVEAYDQGTFQETRTGADGRYRFPTLRGDRYTLFATEDPTDEPRTARSGPTVVELAEGERAADVDIELVRPGSVAFEVRTAEGHPVSGAAVWLRREDGVVLDPVTRLDTDAGGRALDTTLPPGTYTASARADGLATADSPPFRVAPGRTVEVSLTLEPATLLRVVLVDEAGAPISGWASVQDDEGRDVGSMIAEKAVFELFVAGAFAPASRLFGPLPPGRYRVEANAPGGLSAEQTLLLEGQEETVATLRLR